MREKLKVINLFGGAGIGKSTLSSIIFANLKRDGIDCELVTEYAKDKVWEEATIVLDNQVYVFGNQFHRLNRVVNKVDIAITDSPILLSTLYNNKFSKLDDLVLECHNGFDNINLFLERKVIYNENGRRHTLDESIAFDMKLKMLLDQFGVKYTIVNPMNEELIMKIIKENI